MTLHQGQHVQVIGHDFFRNFAGKGVVVGLKKKGKVATVEFVVSSEEAVRFFPVGIRLQGEVLTRDFEGTETGWRTSRVSDEKMWFEIKEV